MQDKAALAPVEQTVQSAWPIADWADVHVLVAVSGGADSVALLRALLAIKRSAAGRGELHVAHLDHRQRGAASSADAAWVEQLAGELGVPVHVGRTADEAPASEETLRDRRRAFLVETAGKVGARWIATGHQADDQAETVLFRLLRGTGVRGLAGIAPRRPVREGLSWVRPLLTVRRSELRAYLAELGQSFREDATNESVEPTRNWLRRELLPAAAERFGPGVNDALCRLASQAAETEQALQHFAQLALDDAASEVTGEGSVAFRVEPLVGQPTAVQVAALQLVWRRAGWAEQAMAAEHWRRLADWVAGAAPSLPQLPGAVHGRREGELVVLSRPSPPVLP